MNNDEWRQRQFLLPALRLARRQLRYAADEIDAMGIMLASGGITIQEAVDWLDRLGLTGYVGEMAVRLLSPEEGDEAEIQSEEAA